MSYFKHMKSIARSLALVGASLFPFIAFAQPYMGGPYSQNTTTGYSFGFMSTSGGFGGGFGSCSSSICGVADTILYLINNVAVPLIFAIAFIVFLYGVAKSYIFSHGEPGDVEEGHKLILWGIIGFVVMVSLWGLVNVVANTFGLGGVSAPVPPVSYPY